MKATEIIKGTKFIFTPTGVEFEVANVTDTRISWYHGFAVKSSWGKNTQRMTWASMKQFQHGLDDGSYIIKQ